MTIRRITRPPGTLVFLLALSFLLPTGSVLFSATDVFAESRYVKPSAEIALRAGEGTKYKILGVVKDGDVVELLEEGDSYARVRLTDGQEGWMLKRFLSITPPLSVTAPSLRAENEKLKQREIEVTQKYDEISASFSRMETELQTILAERDQLKSDYQNLQEATADVMKIKEDMLQATKENELLVQQMASLKAENSNLNKEKSINWFLAGGGVLLVGMSIGRLTSKSRKRKSSLM
jgi:SH3 domain protein